MGDYWQYVVAVLWLWFAFTFLLHPFLWGISGGSGYWPAVLEANLIILFWFMVCAFIVLSVLSAVVLLNGPIAL